MLTPGEIRKTFDEQACARDPGLAAEVEWERALASQRAAESVLAAYPFLGDPECE
jgi:hypothetical protein